MTSFAFGLLCLSSLVTIIDPLAAAPYFERDCLLREAYER